MVATTDNKRRYNNDLTPQERRAIKYKQYEYFENMPCYIHPKAGHKLKDCYDFINKYKKGGRNNHNIERKNGEPKKEDKKIEEDFHEATQKINVIFSGVPEAKSKQKQKLAIFVICFGLWGIKQKKVA